MSGWLSGSAWLWWGGGVLLWSWIGVLAASSRGLSLVVGGVAGAVGWFIGVAVLLLVGAARPVVGAATTWGSVSPADAANQAPVQRHSFFDDDDDWSGVGGAGEVNAGDIKRERSGGPWTWSSYLPPAVIVGAIAVVTSAFLPWGSGSVSVSGSESAVGTSWAPIDFLPAAVLVIVSGLLLGWLGVGARRRIRGRWLAISLMISVFWLIVGLEVAISVAGTSGLSDLAAVASGDNVLALVSAGAGLWLLCGGTALVLVWAAACSALLITARRPA